VLNKLKTQQVTNQFLIKLHQKIECPEGCTICKYQVHQSSFLQTINFPVKGRQKLKKKKEKSEREK